MINYEHYTYKVTWSEEDQEYLGLCAEFPSLSFLDENRFAALEGITNLIQSVVTDMEANNESIPQPFAEKSYSGKFQVRIPPEHHRRLAREAALQNVSLNRYISLKLAS